MLNGSWIIILDEDCTRCKKYANGKCPIVHKHHHMAEELSDPNRFKGESKIFCDNKEL